LTRQFVDVGAGHERLLASAGDDHDTNLVVVPASSAARRSSSSVCALSAFMTQAG